MAGTEGMNEAEFLANYDPRAYAPVAVTVDVAALTIRDGVLCVLLVRRANHPFQGRWCMPGGFLGKSGEQFPALDTAAEERLRLETGLAADADHFHLEQLGSFGKPGRDPRMHVISVAYLAFAPRLPDPEPGEGATEAAWVPVTKALAMPLAFDHHDILEAALARARGKLEYTPLATAFLPSTFTIPQLQAVYEIIWGQELVDPDFRRKALAADGFVEPIGLTKAPEAGRPGRPAKLYRAGDCELLMPPIMSKATKARARVKR